MKEYVFEIKMSDTERMMNSSDYRERFVAEYVQTKIRYEKLKAFNTEIEAARRIKLASFELSGHGGVVLKEPTHDCPEDLLREQQSIMGQYLHVLEVRAEIEGIDIDEKIKDMLRTDDTCCRCKEQGYT
jgi:hypothetical protein